MKQEKKTMQVGMQARTDALVASMELYQQYA